MIPSWMLTATVREAAARIEHHFRRELDQGFAYNRYEIVKSLANVRSDPAWERFAREQVPDEQTSDDVVGIALSALKLLGVLRAGASAGGTAHYYLARAES